MAGPHKKPKEGVTVSPVIIPNFRARACVARSGAYLPTMMFRINSQACSILLLGFSASAFAAEVIDLSQPVSASIKPDYIYWNFDGGNAGESEPNPVEDQSGNGFNGFLLPGASGARPVYVEGKFGTGIRLQGSDSKAADARISWNPQDALGSDDARGDLAGSSFTVGAWVKFNEVRSGEFDKFIVFNRGIIEKGALELSILKTTDSKWRLRVIFPGGYKDAGDGAIDFSDGEWHHVATSYEKRDGDGVLSIWFDGVQVKEGIAMEGELAESGVARERMITVGERNVSFFNSNADASVDDLFVTSGVQRFRP